MQTISIDIYAINSTNALDPVPQALGFPAAQCLFRPAPADTEISSTTMNAIVEYNGQKYYTDETVADLITASNA